MLTNTKPLLLVDDDATNQDLLSRRLKRAGYATEVAGSGYEALDVLARREVELVLLDSMMPGLSGIDLLRQLRQRFTSARLPIIMVTALGESDRVVEALNLGANDYISKPSRLSRWRWPASRPSSSASTPRTPCARAKSVTRWRRAEPTTVFGTGICRPNACISRPAGKPCWATTNAEIGDGPDEWLSRVHKEDRAAHSRPNWPPSGTAHPTKECAIEHRCCIRTAPTGGC